MDPTIFIELSKILIITVFVTAIMHLFKQPSTIGYILSGIIVGPSVLGLVNSTSVFTVFSQIGVSLLLFFVGINLNPKVIKEVGKVSLITGLGQVLFTSGVGFLIAYMLGFSVVVSAYISIALAFSSTIIIMKLLSDKKDLDSLYGRISVGFLIIQDFIAIAILLVISSINSGGSLTSLAIESIFKGIGGILVLLFITVHGLPRLTKVIANSQEFLLLFSITWCFAIATIFHYLNFSIEIGALLAGMTLSLSAYHFEISSKLKPLRDFFLTLFFVMLGSQMMFGNVISNIGIILLFSFFVLVGNPIIVMILMGVMGYTKRNSFLCGLTVAQISEFSLIVVSMGVYVGHVSQEILSILTAVGLITFAGSTYLILYSNKIYLFLSKYLSVFEKKGKKVDEHVYHETNDHDIILFGYNRIGFDVLESLKRIKKKFLIIDYDPEVITKLNKDGFDCRYGDCDDKELLNEINFDKAKMVISTIADVKTNILLINHIKSENSDVIISVVSNQIEDAVELYEQGATYVLMPHFLGGKHFSTMIETNKLDPEKFLEDKIAHIEHLHKRVHGKS